MTIEELVKTFQESHPTNNPNCNGCNCKQSDSIVRIIPLDNSINVNLCQDCFDVELGISYDRELEGLEPILPTFVPFSAYPVYFIGEV
jgi:hypothetical protein